MLNFLQSKLIFIGAASQNTPEARIPPSPTYELLQLQSPTNTKIAALFAPALTANPTQSPTLLYFYGNAMCMADALDQIPFFTSLPANLMLVDYAGYGLSAGIASEHGCYDAAEAAFQHLLTRTDINKSKIIPTGWSLGGSVALDLAFRHRNDAPNPFLALITFSTYTSMPAVAKHHYPLLPCETLVTHRFDSLKKIPHLTLPIFLAHGQRDSIIPFEMAHQLTAATKAPITHFLDPTADHNDFFALTEQPLHQALQTFLSKIP